MRIGAMCPHAKSKARIARLLKDRREYRHLGERQLIRHISDVLPPDAWREHVKWLKNIQKQQSRYERYLYKRGKVGHQ
jgi:hypothetical protein